MTLPGSSRQAAPGAPGGSPWQEVHPGVWRHSSSAYSYALKHGEAAVLVNVGDGSLLDTLSDIGVMQVTAALFTHAGADVAGGAARLAEAGIPLYAPESEQPLLEHPQHFLSLWAGANNYDGRPLHLYPSQGVTTLPLRDYRALTLGAFSFTPRPAPGPSAGHSVLLCEVGGSRLAFTGALLSGMGQVPRLSATMWSYNGGEGLAGSILSALDLSDQAPALLLGAFGPPLPPEALPATAEALAELLRLRRHNPRLFQLREEPYQKLRPYLLMNRSSLAYSYVLRSARGRALVFDFGYDFAFGQAPGEGRESRRPWLYTLPQLLRDHGVSRIDAVLPTHPHDDHVAGIPLLREVYGAELWAAGPMADVLAHPQAHRLPCRWFEPMPPDRVLDLGQPIRWEEFSITPYPLPGHARHAVALLVEGLGERLLFIGDHYADADALGLNYTYQNDALESDYQSSAALIEALRPDLLLSGHWLPVTPDRAWYEHIRERGEALRQLHGRLQPLSSRLGLSTQVEGNQLHLTFSNPTDQDFEGLLSLDHQPLGAVRVAAGSHLLRHYPLQGPARLRAITLQGAPGEPPLMTYAEG